MKILRYIIILLQIFAITFYPQMASNLSAATVDQLLPNAMSSHAIHSGHGDHNTNDMSLGAKVVKLASADGHADPISGPVQDDPCCSISGGMCVTMICQSQEISPALNRSNFEISPSAPLGDVNPSLLPHPPKLSA